MNRKFYEISFANRYPTVNEVTYPDCPLGCEDHVTFLAYAENKNTAFILALAHKYDSKPLEKFYGTYNGEEYHGDVMCVI